MTKPVIAVGACALLLGVAACGPGGDDDDDGACSGILPGELVITEIFADADAPEGGSGADEGKEWFEIYNGSGGALDLEGITVLHARPDGSADHAITLTSVTVEAGGYLVLGDVLPEFVGDHLDYGFGEDLGGFFNENGGRLTLSCGDDVIDEVLYDVVETGRSTGFDGGAPPDYTANDDLTLWCTPPEDPQYEFLPSNFGTPGQVNYDCAGGSTGMCMDGNTPRPIVVPTAGQLVITEVHPNPSGDDNLQEWFEVLVTADVDLNGIQLDRVDDSSNPDAIDAPDCLAVTAGTYLVFGKSLDPLMNGTLPRVDGLFGFTLVDSGDVRVLDPGGAVIDAMTWTNAAADASRQLDPDFLEAIANDMERYWCDGTAAWAVGDLGSPGMPNVECTILPPAGMCLDGGVERAIVAPTAGQLVITEVHPNPSGDDTKQEFIELRASAAVDLNGIQLDRGGDTANPVSILSSDCIEVAAGGYALFARSALTAENGGLPTVDGTFSFSLVDTCTAPTCDVHVNDSTGALLDAMTWTNATNDAARQLDPDITDTVGNDTETNWCDATTTYNGGADTGTPKAVNDVQCP